MSHSKRIPKLRRHKPSERAVVTLAGVDHYLGAWSNKQKKPPFEVQAAYDRLIAEWLAGRCITATPGAAISLAELMVAYIRHAEQHYRREDGTQTNEVEEITRSMRPLNHLYGQLLVTEFSPLKLKAIRQLMINGYEHPKYGTQVALCRNLINQRIGRIVRMFKWAVSEEQAPESVYNALRTVSGLAKGRTEARETDPVEPVSDEVVEKTLPLLLKPVQAMVRLQRLTGMRPGEVCAMKPEAIDMSGEMWVYRPEHHKTRYRGKERVVVLGPKAQDIIRPYLKVPCPGCCNVERAMRFGWTGELCGPCHDQREDGLLSILTEVEEPPGDYYLFTPQLGLELRWEAKRKTRKTKVQPSQVCRKKKNYKKKWQPCYDPRTYLMAIRRAAKKAGVEHWHPHQLRHTHATEVRKQFGLEAAQVALGHSQASVTQIYAEKNLQLAVEVAKKIG